MSIMPTPEQAVPATQFLFLAVRETYARPRTGQFDLYTSLLPASTEFLCRQARHPDQKDHPKLLLTLGDRFALAFHHPEQAAPSPTTISRRRGRPFRRHPTHPRVRRLVDEFSMRFGLDLAAHFRGQPVATLYQ